MKLNSKHTQIIAGRTQVDHYFFLGNYDSSAYFCGLELSDIFRQRINLLMTFAMDMVSIDGQMVSIKKDYGKTTKETDKEHFTTPRAS